MRRMTRTSILAAVCVAALFGGYTANALDYIDTTGLPRGEGTRELYANPAVTSFTTPGTVAEAGEIYRKLLVEAGWQPSDRVISANAANYQSIIMEFRKDRQAVAVHIWRKPAQDNATSVSYTAVLLGNDQPQATAATIARPPSGTVPAVAAPAVAPAARTESPQATPGMQGGRGAAEATARVATSSSTGGTDEPVRAPSIHVGPMPLPSSVSKLEYDSAEGRLEFDSTLSVQALAAFYRDQLKPQGWREEPSVINRPNMVVLNLVRGDKKVSFTILQMGPRVNVSARGSGLSTGARREAPPARVANRDAPVAPAVAPAPVEAPAPVAAAAPAGNDDLEVEDSGGLPMPKSHISSTGTNSPFRNEVQAETRLDLAVVLDFYRRELSKRGWKENAGATVKADQAVLAFTTADGPGQLRLGRADDKTVVTLSLRKPGAAEKAGMLPKAGQVKLLLGNMTDEEAVITIDKHTIKVAAGAGRQSPDGPRIDLPPGKYTYTLKLASRAAQSQEVEVGADETWGLLVGPGGVLPMHLY